MGLCEYKSCRRDYTFGDNVNEMMTLNHKGGIVHQDSGSKSTQRKITNMT